MNLLFEKKLSFASFKAFDEKPNLDFAHVIQTHSSIVIDAKDAPREADGIFTHESKTLAIKTADCLPIAIKGTKGMALIHAGWKGLAHHILLQEEIKSLDPQEFFIGPSIHVCCFEVTEEFAQNFPQGPLLMNTDGKLRFDLQKEAQRQIVELYPAAKISDSGICTCCNSKFPSFRRDKTTKRIWNLLVPLAQ
ncbi:MAG: polyphenol oxidase family protein [Bacteriovoracaceae bacterium]|nr:polyphenol oxidase family protein [Bacteriovoracaceae bacterium]